MLRVLVAGCGYVGSRLAADLKAAGHEVVALKRGSAAIDNVETITADLTVPSTLSLPHFDAAFFTAAPDASDEPAYRSIYVDGSRNLRNALSPETRLFFTSSTAVYGQDGGSIVDEDSPTTPSSFRGRVLLEAEGSADVVLRLAGIYGPGRSRALDRVRRGEARYEPGRYLNLIHRDDASRALLHLMTLDQPERVYLGVDQEPVDSEQLYRWLAERSGSAPPRAEAAAASRGTNKRCSSARLVASGFCFRYPTFRDGYGELIGSRVLAPCPPRPNCISSRAPAGRHHLAPLRFTGLPLEARDAVVTAVEACGGHVVEIDGPYVRAEFSSPLFGFVDDVEWVISESDARIDFRSASRVGYYDFGVNRRRLDKIIRRLFQDKKISPRGGGD